ncbi:MAG: hypothetical protein NTZ75_05425 [Euryarchaeota archaeon]|nr:hypothetical protein [Euryarchaeota archaeon]
MSKSKKYVYYRYRGKVYRYLDSRKGKKEIGPATGRERPGSATARSWTGCKTCPEDQKVAPREQF